MTVLILSLWSLGILLLIAFAVYRDLRMSPPANRRQRQRDRKQASGAVPAEQGLACREPGARYEVHPDKPVR